MATKTKTLRMTEELLKKVEVRAKDVGYQNVSEYLRHLIYQDLKRVTK